MDQGVGLIVQLIFIYCNSKRMIAYRPHHFYFPTGCSFGASSWEMCFWLEENAGATQASWMPATQDRGVGKIRALIIQRTQQSLGRFALQAQVNTPVGCCMASVAT